MSLQDSQAESRKESNLQPHLGDILIKKGPLGLKPLSFQMVSSRLRMGPPPPELEWTKRERQGDKDNR